MSWYRLTHCPLGGVQSTIQAFDKVIEINPQLSMAWDNRGVAFYLLGLYNEAIQSFDKAIENDPKNANAWNGKGGAPGR